MWLSSWSPDFRTRQNHIQRYDPLHSKDWKLYCHCSTHETSAGGGLVPQQLISVGHYEPMMFVKFLCFSTFTGWKSSTEQLFEQFYYRDPLSLIDSQIGLTLEQGTSSQPNLPRRGTLTEGLQPVKTPQSHQRSTYTSTIITWYFVSYILDPVRPRCLSKAT